MNITYLSASDKATYSASELESDTLFYNFDYQETGTTSTYSMKPLLILLLTGSPV